MVKRSPPPAQLGKPRRVIPVWSRTAEPLALRGRPGEERPPRTNCCNPHARGRICGYVVAGTVATMRNTQNACVSFIDLVDSAATAGRRVSTAPARGHARPGTVADIRPEVF